MKRTSKCFILIFTALFFVNQPISAIPSYEQIEEQKQYLQENKNKLEQAQDTRFEIEQNIESLDNQIEEIMNNIQENNEKISNIQEEIKSTEEQLKQSEEDMKKQEELFKERVKVMYINGVGGYLEVLLASESFSDFISRVELVKDIIEMDKKIISNLESKQEQLEKDKIELNEQKEELTALNIENNEKMDKLKAYKDEQSDLIKEAEEQEKLYSSTVAEEEAKLNQILEQLEQQSRTTVSRGGTSSVSSSSIVSYALTFLGTPYKWGGTTPSGFDCSGFTQYVFKHFGINLSRTTYTQINDGYYVPKSELKPGDLVFYGSGSPTHVGIYIGNGMYIHSPRTGDVIKVSSYDRSDYITARRVTK